jgi:hypothetical protein
VRHNGVALPFRVFDKIRTVEPGTIVENKRLTEALAHVRARQASLSEILCGGRTVTPEGWRTV